MENDSTRSCGYGLQREGLRPVSLSSAPLPLSFFLRLLNKSIIILSNICSDFDKIEDEFKELDERLKASIADEKQRTETAFKIIFEKYPNTRGFELISENINKLFP